MSDLVYVLTPDSKVVFQIQNWINGQDKNWESGETSDNSWKRKSNIAWLKPNKRINQAIELFASRESCDWISVDHKDYSGTFDSIPTRELLSNEINENYIVELYSR